MAVFEISTPHILGFLALAIVSFVVTRMMIFVALRLDWTAKSNPRSSHIGKLAYGGGIPVIGLALIAWIFQILPANATQVSIVLGAVGLAVLSLVDDMKPLSARVRFGFQVVAVFAGLYFLPNENNILPLELPVFIDRLIAALCWLWFINLFNFMDGIDGLAGVETICVALGIALVGSAIALEYDLVLLATVLAAAGAGFLPWNWHKAKIMLGDVGSIPIGFMLGYLLIRLVAEGYFLAAIILPAYFVADASLTMVRRLLRGEKIWQAHREHFYQRATPQGARHDRVVITVALANMALILAAYLSISHALFATIGAIVVIVALLIWLAYLEKH